MLIVHKTIGRLSVRLTHAGEFAGYAIATLLSAAAAIIFSVLVSPTATFNASEVHLTSATIIGGAFALVLSLSIIPAQKAAESFSSAILRLYARDRSLLAVFAVLSATTIGSVLMGTFEASPPANRLLIAGEFLLLGISFDALRSFYLRTLKLLNPHTAIGLVVIQCNRLILKSTRAVDRSIGIQKLLSAPDEHEAVSRAMFFKASGIASHLNGWIQQLDEFGHKAIARRETQTVTDILGAFQAISHHYVDVRSSSIILLPDLSNLFGGGHSDVSDVLDQIYERIRAMCHHAASDDNELVVQECIAALGNMTLKALTIVHTRDPHWSSTPLAHSPCFYLKLCGEIAIKHRMENATLTATQALGKALQCVPDKVDTKTTHLLALEALFEIALVGYTRPDSVQSFPAVSAMFRGAHCEIAVRGYWDQSMLTTVLRKVAQLLPLEIQMEKAGKRVMEVFPPYSGTFDSNIALILQTILQASGGRQHAAEQKRRRFGRFLSAAKEVLEHYYHLSRVQFGQGLLLKWIVETAIDCARLHIAALSDLPSGEEGLDKDGGYTGVYTVIPSEIEDSVDSYVNAIAFLFGKQTEFPAGSAKDACEALSCLGMEFLQAKRPFQANTCGIAISAIAKSYAGPGAQPYLLADMFQSLEVLARAADACDGDKSIASVSRSRIAVPESISLAQRPSFEEAIQTRMQQLDKSLFEGNFGLPRDDPVALLYDLLRQRSPSQRPT